MRVFGGSLGQKQLAMAGVKWVTVTSLFASIRPVVPECHIIRGRYVQFGAKESGVNTAFHLLVAR